MNINTRRCVVCSSSKGITLFRFPSDETRSKQWVEIIGKPELKQFNPIQLHNRRICAKHFEDWCFPNTLYKRLSRFALPSARLVGPDSTCNEPYPVHLQCNDAYKEVIKPNSSLIKKEPSAENTGLTKLIANASQIKDSVSANIVAMGCQHAYRELRPKPVINGSHIPVGKSTNAKLPSSNQSVIVQEPANIKLIHSEPEVSTKESSNNALPLIITESAVTPKNPANVLLLINSESVLTAKDPANNVLILVNSESEVMAKEPVNNISPVVNSESKARANEPVNNILPIINSISEVVADSEESSSNFEIDVVVSEPSDVEEFSSSEFIVDKTTNNVKTADPTIQHDSYVSDDQCYYIGQNPANMEKLKTKRTKGTFASDFKYHNLSEQKITLYTGLSKDVADVLLELMQRIGVIVKCKLEIAEQMLLVFMRLKLGLLIEDLADRFCISPSIASKIFREWICALKIVLGNIVCWLPTETVKVCHPSKFREHYPNTTCVLDCVELFTQKMKKHDARDQMYSLYNSHKALKLFIAVAPQGYIMGISSYHLNKTGDKNITLNDEFLKMLQSQNEVMVDQRLRIGPELSKIGVKVTIPSSCKVQDQTKDTEIQDFSSVHSEVERILKRIKAYNIINTVIPIKNVSFAKDVVLVISALANLTLPIVKRLIMEAESNDTHLCLGCKGTVVGLENYKMHRNKICNSYKKSLTNLMDSKWKKPIVCHKNGKSLCGLKLHNESTLPKKFTLDTYSLGTEKSYKLVSPSLLEHSLVMDGRQSHEVVLVEQDTNLSNGTKSHETRTYPRTFCTEVKSGYHSNTNDGVLLKTNSSSSLHINESYSVEKKKRITITNCNLKNNIPRVDSEQTSKDIKCEPCGKIFNTKMEVMVHVFSLEHREKFDNIEQWYDSIFCHQESLIYSSLFQCSICKYYFNNHEEFVAHLKSKCHSQNVTNLNLSLLCASCEFECLANVELLNHIVSKEHQQIVHCKSQYHPIVITKTNENACQYCNSNCQLMEMQKDQQNVTTTSEKQDNIISNCNSRNYEVQDNQIILPEESFQSGHLSNRIVTSNTVFLCQQCNKLFTHLEDWKTHIDLNHSKKCQSRDSFNSSLLASKQLCDHIYWRQHKRKPLTQKNSKRIKSCKNEQLMPYSYEMLNRDTGFQVGIKIPTQEKEQYNKDAFKKYNCSYCNKSFDTKSILKFHIFTHTGEKPYKCDMCSKAFAQSSSRFIHRRSHFGVKRLKCDKCDYRAHNKSTMLKHKQTHGVNRTRNFLCDICGNAYFDKFYLKRHMQYHNGYIHKCTFPGCSRAFSTPCELTYHMRIHTNEKPYLCDICGKSLRTSTLLKFHRLKHAERWNYKCPYCSYVTNFRARLQQHVLKTNQHSRELVFPCKFCSFSGNGLKEYRDHLLLNHSEKFPNGRKQIDSMLISGVHFESIPEKTTKSKYNVTNKPSSEFHNRKLKKIMNSQNNIVQNAKKTIHSGSRKRKSKAFTSVTTIPAFPSVVRNAENGGEEMVSEHSECTIYIEIPTTEICETVELSSEMGDKQPDVNEILQAMSAIQ